MEAPDGRHAVNRHRDGRRHGHRCGSDARTRHGRHRRAVAANMLRMRGSRRRAAPLEWPLAGRRPVPRFSHLDGTPLCPVVGPDGYTPAEPTDPDPAAARTAPADTAATGPTEPPDATVTGGDSKADDQCRTES
jgi:hypothetical protein